MPLFGGCASAERGGRWTSAAIREDFDPESLQDDDFLLTPLDAPESLPKTPSPLTAPVRTGPSTPRETSRPERPAAGPTFRVQVAAVATSERAAQVRQEVERVLGVPAIIQQDASLYRVQAGDLRGRPEAEKLLALAQGKGYPGAFMISVPGKKSGTEAPPSKPPDVSAETPAPSPGPQGEARLPLQMVPAQGYRVQIFSVADREEAQRFFDEAKRRLGREDIYFQFEPPFFRVRVGNCRTRDAAEDLVRELEQAGYEAPFPVRTQILAPESVKSGSE